MTQKQKQIFALVFGVRGYLNSDDTLNLSLTSNVAIPAQMLDEKEIDELIDTLTEGMISDAKYFMKNARAKLKELI